MSKLLVVVNATGTQGQAVISHFLTHYSQTYHIRGLTRNPTSSSARALSKRGVEVIQADLDDPSSLDQAFRTANAIFAYTATDSLTTTPEAQEYFRSGKVGSTGEAAYPIEIRQGRNIADAASKVPRLERLVWSSLSNITKRSGGKYTQAWHEIAKAEVAEYMLQHEELGGKGKVSTVVLGVFADNAVRASELFGPRKQGDGSYLLALPSPGLRSQPWIDIASDTGSIVAALLQASGGWQVLGASEFMSFREWLQLWSSHLGVKARYEEIPIEDFCKDDSDGASREIAETLHFFEEFGYTGGNPDVVTIEEFELKSGISVPRTKIIESIRRVDWSGML